MTDNCLGDLKRMCKDIGTRLEMLSEGYIYNKETGEIKTRTFHVPKGEEDRYTDLYGYLSDNLGVTITKSLGDDDCDFKSCCITMAWGGPGIYIDTDAREVQGRWWGTNYDYALSDEACTKIEDCVRMMIL